MYVRNWMTRPAITLPEHTKAIDALELMQVRRIRRLPVLREGSLVGILTLADLQAVLGIQEHRRGRADVCLGDIMTREVSTVSPDDPLERASRLMLEQEISGLPVVEDGAVVGIITESDVFGAFTRIMGILDRGVRIVLTVPETEDLLPELLRRTRGMAVQSLAAYPSPGGGWEAVVRVRGRSGLRSGLAEPR
jgi:acetoin utilization protein AcuB